MRYLIIFIANITALAFVDEIFESQYFLFRERHSGLYSSLAYFLAK